MSLKISFRNGDHVLQRDNLGLIKISNLVLDPGWVESWWANLVQIYYYLKLDFLPIISVKHFEERQKSDAIAISNR